MTVFGLAVFAFFYGGFLRANSRRWRYLADRYAANGGPAIDKRHMRSPVLIGLGAFNSYGGIVTISVHPAGVGFSVMPIFSLFHPPIFVPYADIHGWRTTWFLDARSSELEFRRAPDVKLILTSDDAEWILSHATGKFVLSDERPPQGNAGRKWHAVLVMQSFAALLVFGWISIHLLISLAK